MIQDSEAKEKVRKRLETLIEKRDEMKMKQEERGTFPGIEHTNEALIEKIEEEIEFLEDLLGSD